MAHRVQRYLVGQPDQEWLRGSRASGGDSNFAHLPLQKGRRPFRPGCKADLFYPRPASASKRRRTLSIHWRLSPRTVIWRTSPLH